MERATRIFENEKEQEQEQEQEEEEEEEEEEVYSMRLPHVDSRQILQAIPFSFSPLFSFKCFLFSNFSVLIKT